MKKMLKKTIKTFIRSTSGIPIVGRAYDVLPYLERFSGAIYNLARPSEVILGPVAKNLLQDLHVRNGPFRGMRYTNSNPHSLLPKLVGSYESELHSTISSLPHDYSAVIVIGCAEGYYAVGLSLLMPTTHVYAFDTSTQCQVQCREIAELNKAADRISIGGTCDQTTLTDLVSSHKRCLILSDCEGYEKVLFDHSMASHLKTHDVIIETHDHIDMEISGTIKNAFASTHTLTSIFSTDDNRKAREYNYPETAQASLHERRQIFAEGRPGIMEWIVARSSTV